LRLRIHVKFIATYFSVPIGVSGGKSGCMFTPVNVEVTCYEPEVVGGMLIHGYIDFNLSLSLCSEVFTQHLCEVGISIQCLRAVSFSISIIRD
jgi:hypothetical protein